MVIMSTMLIVGCLSSCNPQRKIQKAEQVLKDADALAKICADEFPVKEVFIKGDSVLLFDTLYVGENIFDTVYKTFNDTVTRVVTKTLPAKIVTKTVRITDTIVKENTARIEDFNIQLRNKEIENGILKADRDNWKVKSKTKILVATNCHRSNRSLYNS